MLHDAGRRRYWLYADRVYWEDEASAPPTCARWRTSAPTGSAAGSSAPTPPPRRPARPPPAAARPARLRAAVWARDGGACAECGARFDLQYDHVIPVALGGATTMENLQVLCAPCNQRKGAALG